LGAKLLFQYRVVAKGKRLARRVCEERTILIRARGAKEALAKAKRYGAGSEFTDHRSDRQVFFEFVGVIEMDDVMTDFNENPAEVWWEFRELVRPMERRRMLLAAEKDLRAFNLGTKGRGRMRVW
jgi:hypothetical protein